MLEPASTKATVLVVDDDHLGAEALSLLLQQGGFATFTAHSGGEALECAQKRPPDLVLMDVVMPDLDGFETCERMHRLPGLADLPVIFLTGASDRAAVSRAFEAGARDYVTKPYLLEELLARVRTHADLKLSRDRLAQALREREEITSVVAHDLKNPLTCVLFAAQSMLRPNQDAARREELVADVLENTRYALAFIQRFLSRSAEGQRLREFSARRVNLLDVAHQAARQMRHAAEGAGVSFAVSGDAAEAMVDPGITHNVLQNLLSNAIQYSPRGSSIDVMVARMPTGFAQCRVMDRGPGVPEADRAKLFTRFLSVAKAADRSPYSSGLGLAIAKHDVTQMGGYLWYDAREGGGSIFGFDLPAP
jgi:two-component system, sensor histidine kinase and response regulator